MQKPFSAKNKTMASISFKIYSFEDGLTLDKWVDLKSKQQKEDYNPLKVTESKATDLTINGMAAKKVYYTIEKSGKEYLYCSIYIIGKSYKYLYTYNVSDNSDKELIAKIEGSLDKIKFEEPDTTEFGKLIDIELLDKSKAYEKIDSKKYGWSMEVPLSWSNSGGYGGYNSSYDYDSYDSYGGSSMYNSYSSYSRFSGSSDIDSPYISYYDFEKYKGVSLSVIDADNVDLTVYKNSIEEYYKNNEKFGNVKLVSSTQETRFGTTVYKYVSQTKLYGNSILQTDYLMKKGGYVYRVQLYIDQLYLNDISKATLEYIWSSFNIK